MSELEGDPLTTPPEGLRSGPGEPFPGSGGGLSAGSFGGSFLGSEVSLLGSEGSPLSGSPGSPCPGSVGGSAGGLLGEGVEGSRSPGSPCLGSVGGSAGGLLGEGVDGSGSPGSPCPGSVGGSAGGLLADGLGVTVGRSGDETSPGLAGSPAEPDAVGVEGVAVAGARFSAATSVLGGSKTSYSRWPPVPVLRKLLHFAHAGSSEMSANGGSMTGLNGGPTVKMY